MRHRLLIAGLAVSVTLAAGTDLVTMAQDKSGSTDDRATAMDGPLDQMLVRAGIAPKLVDIFSSVTTEVVSSGKGRYHILQRVPALSMRREIRIAIHSDKQLQEGSVNAAKTAAGYDVYPLHHTVRRFPGGYDRYQAFFLPHDNIEPGA